MATLTAADRKYVQRNTGIGTAEAVYTNSDLDEFYTDAGGSRDETVVQVLRALMVDAAKLYDYRIAQSAESQSQVFKNLQSTLVYWEDRVARATRQVKIVGMVAVPPKWKDRPR